MKYQPTRYVDYETIKARHKPAAYASLNGDGSTLDQLLCVYCSRDWPCDAQRLITRLSLMEMVRISEDAGLYDVPEAD